MTKLLPILLLLTGCSTHGWYWSEGYAHGSSLHKGEPVNSDCDATYDFVGGGVMKELGNTDIHIWPVGVKHIRPCGQPPVTQAGAMVIVAHKHK